MERKKLVKELAAACANNIENYELRVQLAIDVIGRMRCPLSMADFNLYYEMMDQIWWWGFDNEIDVDDIDAEEVLWEG